MIQNISHLYIRHISFFSGLPFWLSATPYEVELIAIWMSVTSWSKSFEKYVYKNLDFKEKQKQRQQDKNDHLLLKFNDGGDNQDDGDDDDCHHEVYHHHKT